MHTFDNLNSKPATGQDPCSKLKSLTDLALIVSELKRQGKAVVHCHGVFDLVHLGHIRHFQQAKRQGDVLIVTLTPDRYVNKGPGRPVFTEGLRAEALSALEMVDYVAINEWPTAEETIRILKPSIYAKGSEYARAEDDLTGKILDEEQAILAVGGRLYFTGDITFSASHLLNSFFGNYPSEARLYLAEFRQRYSADDLIGKLKSLQNMRVLVLGDVIIDEYHFCKALGKSSKSASINARFLHAEAYAGGALAVANHVAGFCGVVHLVSCVGATDSRLDFIRGNLRSNITSQIFVRPDGPTTVKRRYTELFQYTKMFEVTFIEDCPLPAAIEEELNEYISRALRDYDLVLIADFGHGLISGKTVSVLCSSDRFLAVNSQTNSANSGYNIITKYPRVDYVCVDQEEIRLAFHDRFSPVELLVRRAAQELNASTVAVTTGQSGSTTLGRGGKFVETPVFSKEVVDATGAGDAYLAITAPCAAAGYSPDIIGFIGNAVGAMEIRILGNKESIDPASLYKYITALLK
jgi:rfaE bifunctional protein nucleotidyltransferase chain/domain